MLLTAVSASRRSSGFITELNMAESPPESVFSAKMPLLMRNCVDNRRAAVRSNSAMRTFSMTCCSPGTSIKLMMLWGGTSPASGPASGSMAGPRSTMPPSVPSKLVSLSLLLNLP